MALNKNDVMLLDIQYVRASKQKQLPDYLYIVWKEISTGKKHLISIPEPTVDIYFEKPEYRDFDYNKNYEYLNKLDKKTVKYSKIPHCIAADAGPDAQRFLSQPMSVAEKFTGLEGKYVPLFETLRGFKAIVDGKVDELPEAAFFNVGTLRDAFQKAEKIKRGEI